MKKYNTMKVVLLIVTALWIISALFLPDSSWAVLVKCGLSVVELFLLLFCLKDKNNALKVILVTIFALGILAWILPAAYYSGEYIDQGRVQVGLFDLFNYSLTALSYFGFIGLFIIFVGGFYGILYRIPAYRSFLDKIVAICKGKEAIALSIIIVLLTVITSICGLQMGLILFFPMLAAVILLMGYDKIVVALTLVGSTMIGVAGTTFAYNNTGLLNSILGLDMMDNILVKVIILIAGLVLLVFNILMYAKKCVNGSKSALKAAKTVVKSEDVEEKNVVEESKKTVNKKSTTSKSSGTKTSSKGTKKTNSSSATKKVTTAKKTSSSNKNKSSSKSNRKDIKAAAKGDDIIVIKESLINESVEKFVPTVVDSKHKIWPIVTGFILLFIIMLLAFIPWSDTFGLSIFADVTTAVSEFTLFNFPIFGKLLGNVNAFGGWAITDLFLIMALILALLTFIYKVDVNDALDGFSAGAKKAVVPALISVVIYTCLVTTTYHPYQLSIYKALFSIGKGFNVVTSTFAGILSSLFNSDPAYVFQAVIPYFASIVTKSEIYPIVAILYQSMYGVTMLVAPTSLILLIVLSHFEISYKEWLKAIWKLLVELFAVLLIVFTILVLI